MRRITVVTFIFIVFMGTAYSDSIETNSLDLVNTGLTLPESMHQFTFSLAYQRSEMENDVSPGLWYQYGITDRLTLDFIGLKYSFWGSGSPLELAVRGGLGNIAFGYGSESGGVFRVRTYNYLECRYRFSQKIYTDYSLYYDRGIYDNGEPDYHDRWITGLKTGIYYSLTEKVLIGVRAGYNFVGGFEKDQRAEILGFSLGYGLSREIDFVMSVLEKGLLTEKFTGENPYNNEIYAAFAVISRR